MGSKRADPYLRVLFSQARFQHGKQVNKVIPASFSSGDKWRDPAQNIICHVIRRFLDVFGAACRKIDGARLVADNYALGLHSRVHEGAGKARAAS